MSRSVQEAYIAEQNLAQAMQEAVDQLCQERPKDGVGRLSQLLLLQQRSARERAARDAATGAAGASGWQRLHGEGQPPRPKGPFAAKAFTMFLTVWPQLLSATKPLRLGLDDGSITPSKPLSPWRRKMANVVDGEAVQIVILFMLLGDCFVVAMEIAINYTACYDDFEYSEVQELWHHRLHQISLAILLLLATQITLEAIAYGAIWFTKCLNYLDVLIVGSSIIVEELNLSGTWMPVLLLWRVLRVGHAIFTAVETEKEMEEHKDTHELDQIKKALMLHGSGLSKKAAADLFQAITSIMTPESVIKHS